MRCKYSKECKLYSETSVTCNKNGGMYYDDLKVGAGCYRDKEKKK